MKKFLSFAVLLTGCAGITPDVDPRSLGAGAVGGAAITVGAEKIKEVFTPKYPLQVKPIEICDIVSSSIIVTCYITPCTEAPDQVCTQTYGKVQWFKDNPKVVTVQSSLFVSVKQFCIKNDKACEDYLAFFDKTGQKIVVINENQ